ncbi:natriuretic peptides B isoform X1 [Phocoena sinus]|uniref:natriuretic peptides B isoform X1 n=1 Tax=Phocoena sinus TaxID=42100 RepID=UPI0013C3F3D2|nr:natriuretic peptides B isoform X1 [Phocoena sinus]
MDPQTTLPRALMLLLFLHLSLPRCRSYPLGGPGPASELRGIQVSAAELRKPGSPGGHRQQQLTGPHLPPPTVPRDPHPPLGISDKRVRKRRGWGRGPPSPRRSVCLGAIESGWAQVRVPKAPPPPPIAGTAGPSTRQGVGAAGREDGPGPPSAGPHPRRSLGDPGGRPRGAPRARQQRPPGPVGNTQPQDEARLRLLWAEAGPDRLPQRPGLQRAEEVLREGPGCIWFSLNPLLPFEATPIYFYLFIYLFVCFI